MTTRTKYLRAPRCRELHRDPGRVEARLLRPKLSPKLRFIRPPKGGRSPDTAISAHLTNSTAKRRDVAKQLLSQLRKEAEENGANIIASDFNSSAYRKRGTEGMRFIDEAWSETLLVPPPGKVPMWKERQESEDCCGAILTKIKCQSSWRVASHESDKLNRDKPANKEKDEAAHLPVLVHLCETQTERRSRSAVASLYRKKRAKEIRLTN